MFKKIDEWSLETPNGWSDFSGIQRLEPKMLYKLQLVSGDSVVSTGDHSFFTSNQQKKLLELKVGETIDTMSGPQEITDIIEVGIEEVYDIIECEDDHKFIVNSGIITKNCDEFAFVPQNIAEAFWKSNFPTLSAGGNAILVSTPNGAAGKFFEIYKEAESGTSPFKPFKVNWHEYPGRDEKWKEERKRMERSGGRMEYIHVDLIELIIGCRGTSHHIHRCLEVNFRREGREGKGRTRRRR